MFFETGGLEITKLARHNVIDGVAKQCLCYLVYIQVVPNI